MIYFQATRDDMDAREIESLSMISRGFEELRDVNPELAYSLILDVLSGIDEYVSASLTLYPSSCNKPLSRNAAVKQHIQTARGLFPHKRIIRRSEMTAKGLVVTEEEEISGLPLPSSSSPTPVEPEARKSPISELLYMRWLEGLRLKWPSIL